MKFLSVCSGIEAASTAWRDIGFEPFAFSEIEPFCCEVLKHHHPDVANLGDMTKFEEWPDGTIDLLCGGTPCQGFSVAGLRGGMDDARSQLSLAYAGVARRYRPRWLVWENVPGVLSSNGGRDFAEFLGLLSGRHLTVPTEGWKSAGIVPGIDLAYGLAWRVLDAQFVRVDSHARAVPQRRKRVFVVGYSGDWRRAAAVLFESEGLRGDPAPCRKAGKDVTADVGPSIGASGPPYSRTGNERVEADALVVGSLRESDGGPDVKHAAAGQLVPDVAGCLQERDSKGVDSDTKPGHLIATIFKPCAYTRGKDGEASDVSPPITAEQDRGDTHPVVAFSANDDGQGAAEEVSPTLRAMPHATSHPNGGQKMAIAIQAGATRENPDSGPDGIGVKEEVAYTVEARAEVQAVAFAQNSRDEVREQGDGNVAGALAAEPGMKQTTYVAFEARIARNGRGAPSDVVPPLKAESGETGKGDSAPLIAIQDTRAGIETKGQNGKGFNDSGAAYTVDTVASQGVATSYSVRRLTPRECERLQGFPDDYTRIPWKKKRVSECPDGPRYKALGNSMAVNVMRWLGQRIKICDAITGGEQ